MIKESYDDWKQNPIITTTDEFGAPLSDVDFPALTICHEPKYQTDYWALPELIMNFFIFDCWSSTTNCGDSQMLRKDFQPFLEQIYNGLSQVVNESKTNMDLIEKVLFEDKKNFNIYVKDIMKLLYSNETTTYQLNEDLKRGMMKFGTQTSVPFSKLIKYKMYILKQYSKVKESFPCLEKCENDKSEISKLLITALGLATSKDSPGSFGTLLRQFASNLGKTFERRPISLFVNYENSWNAKMNFKNGSVQQFFDFVLIQSMNKSYNYMHSEFDCQNLDDQEILFHAIMNNLGEKLGISASLIDFAKLFRVEPYTGESHKYVSSYPFFSWCKHGNIVGGFRQMFVGDHYTTNFEHQGFHWCPDEPIYFGNGTKVPYSPDFSEFCFNSTEEMVGRNLSTINKLMKFAYHIHNREDVKFIYNQVKESKLSYKMIPFEKMDLKFHNHNVKIKRPYIINSPKFTKKEFIPVITNQGLCFAWNVEETNTVFKPSRFVSHFNEEFLEKISVEPIQKASIMSIEVFLDKQEIMFPDRIQSKKSFL